VTLWKILFVAEDLDVPSYEAVGDASATVYVKACYCCFSEFFYVHIFFLYPIFSMYTFLYSLFTLNMILRSTMHIL